MTLEEYLKLSFPERTADVFLSLSEEDQYKALDIEWEETNRLKQAAWDAKSDEEKERIEKFYQHSAVWEDWTDDDDED